ncbi:RNA-directed DNA polymerase [Pseudomonas sp. JH-2]|uniref:RNA-directed DNA polymerase n=1 Tax=Pseudomonas sp. JH-2 TaxID=3114998 RepID=UPI002E270E6E|nr:RNA-directed DNA polymerase [Pseudomonas sp. JH-2]
MAQDSDAEEIENQPPTTDEESALKQIESLISLFQSSAEILQSRKIKKKIGQLKQQLTAPQTANQKEPEATEFLAFKIELDAVLQHLNQDMRDDWFTDAIQHRDLFSNKNDLRETLQCLLLEGNGKYPGCNRTIYNIPKKGIGVRYSLETDFYDRFIYQSICSFLIPFYDPLLSHRVLGHRYNKTRTSEKYIFKNRIDLWHTFEGVTRTALSNNQALLVTDLINYFENITVDAVKSAFEDMLDHVSASGPEKLLIRNAIQTLCELLTRWGYSEKHGLPQNRDSSSFIANVVLSSVDHAMVKLGYDYYRYVDDIRIICETPRIAKKTLTELINQLRTVGMNINSGKTKILTIESTAADISDSFPTTDDRTLTIESMWRSRSRRVIARSAKYIHQLLRECIEQKETQSRQFRFAVNRLIQLAEAKLFDIHTDLAVELKALLIETLEEHAASTDQYCRILGALSLNEQDLETITAYLQDSEKSIHSWQNFHLWLLLAKQKHKNEALITLALIKIEEDLLQPEVSAIFIYLRCIDESAKLKPLVQKFCKTWPYYHQRNFLLATSEFEAEELKPLIPELHTKLKRTASRAIPYFADGVPLLEREPRSVLDLYEEISPYD